MLMANIVGERIGVTDDRICVGVVWVVEPDHGGTAVAVSSSVVRRVAQGGGGS